MRSVVLFLVLSLAAPVVLVAQEAGRVISCLGRIEPAGGIVRLSGPTALGAVIMDLKVKEGEWVEEGQEIAMLDSSPVRTAALDALKVELELAESQHRREQKLTRSPATSASKSE